MTATFADREETDTNFMSGNSSSTPASGGGHDAAMLPDSKTKEHEL
jgi:hypothetical protein